MAIVPAPVVGAAALGHPRHMTVVLGTTLAAAMAVATYPLLTAGVDVPRRHGET